MMKQIPIDSNFLYSLYNPKESNYRRSQTFTSQTPFIPIIPEIALNEVCFLFFRSGKVPGVVKFLNEFARAGVQPVSATLVDLQRAGEIMAAYAQAELDFVDCIIMALSERLNITQICTYDRRDFSIFRPKHCAFLELLP